MPKLQVLTALPPGNIDSLLAGSPSPPKTVLLPGSNGLRLWLHIAANSAVVRPYYHVGGDAVAGRWVGLGYDAAAGVGMDPVTVDAASGGGVSEGRLVANGEPRYWILLRESGVGLPDDAELSAVDR